MKNAILVLPTAKWLGTQDGWGKMGSCEQYNIFDLPRYKPGAGATFSERVVRELVKDGVLLEGNVEWKGKGGE